MDIQQWIEADKSLLLTLNDNDSLLWDGVMWIVTDTKTWIPAIVMLLYVIFKNNKLSQSLVILLMFAVGVTLADQIASGICKPYFARPRPTQDPEIMYLVNVVNGYRGGAFGFMSSHAANTFVVATLVTLLVRSFPLGVMMYLWAAIPSFSRIYLGVHYPRDIVFGASEGCIVGVLVYTLFRYIQKKCSSRPQYVSSQYTPTGYSRDDVTLLYTVLWLTYFYALIAGMIVTRTLSL